MNNLQATVLGPPYGPPGPCCQHSHLGCVDDVSPEVYEVGCENLSAGSPIFVHI